MGIYDRDYYREDRRGMLDSIFPEGGVCKFLIIALIVVFALQLVDRSNLAVSFGLQLSALMNGEVWRIVTFPFVQPGANPYSFAFSLLFLWWFGSDLEQMYGSFEFLCFYAMSALVGGAAFLAVSYVRGAEGALLMGAFGPITAVTVLYAWHFPNHVIRLFFVLPVPLWLLVVIEILGALMLDPREQAAYVLCGAAFSSLYYKKQWRFSGLFQGWGTWKSRPKSRAKLRVFHPDDDDAEPVGVSAPKMSAPLLDEHLEAKVDAVLEKMARNGKESLSDNERQILLQASEIYRKKRT